METQKICDRCQSSALNDLITECESCGGTSFSFIQGIVSMEQSSSDGHNSETKLKIDKHNINWKIMISMIVIGLFVVVVGVSEIGQVDKKSLVYKRCLYEAKDLVDKSGFAVTPNDSTYLNLAVSLANVEAPRDRKVCKAAYSDLQSVWNNNGGTLNAANWDYIASISAEQEAGTSKPQVPPQPAQPNVPARPSNSSTSKPKVPPQPAQPNVPARPSNSSTSKPKVPPQPAQPNVPARPSNSSSAPGAVVCKPNSNCPVGSIGPAGGLVFYDAGTKQSWGRYLEVSIKDLPEAFGWCSSNDVEGINLETSENIGSGNSNTQKMKAKCNQDSGNAALVAIRYASGGFSDWFIPSLDELLILSHSVAWKEIEPIANGFPIATSTQSETDFRYEYAIEGGTFVELNGGPVVVPMVRAF